MGLEFSFFFKIKIGLSAFACSLRGQDCFLFNRKHLAINKTLDKGGGTYTSRSLVGWASSQKEDDDGQRHKRRMEQNTWNVSAARVEAIPYVTAPLFSFSFFLSFPCKEREEEGG